MSYYRVPDPGPKPRPTLAEVIAALLAPEREPEPGVFVIGPCGRIEPEIEAGT